MDFKTLMSSLFGFSAPTYYSWKKEKRPIILLIEKYFEKEELIEFINTQQVDKLDLIKQYTIDELRELLDYSPKIDKITVNNHLSNFNRTSLLYFLYIFKKETTIKDTITFHSFINKSLKEPDLILSKIMKYFSGYKPTWLKGDNVSLKLHINNFHEDCKDYLNDNELNYIFKHKDYYTDFITRNVENK